MVSHDIAVLITCNNAVSYPAVHLTITIHHEEVSPHMATFVTLVMMIWEGTSPYHS